MWYVYEHKYFEDLKFMFSSMEIQECVVYVIIVCKGGGPMRRTLDCMENVKN